MNIRKNTIIYVGCPAFNKTGGTELAHQLVREINELGGHAKILYYDTTVKNNAETINPAFRKYVDSYSIITDVDDIADNVLIAPEINVQMLDRFDNVQKVIWWMSVDNFLKTNGFSNAIKFYGRFQSIKLLLKRRISISKKTLSNDILHLYQSEYAREFLAKNGISNSKRLSDYLNGVYLDTADVSFENRENNILYNPKKGIAFTKKIINLYPDYNWIPIQNMSNTEVRSLLLRSKVYIDFGNHPGKDRFPREAAISGCCIITGMDGSAANNIDICIPEKYKIKAEEKNIQRIIKVIDECLQSYKINIDDFTVYREKILQEKSEFKKDVKDTFSL